MTPQQAKEFFGSQTAIAKVLGAAQSSVCEWFDNGKIPEGRQYQIELATKGKLKADKPARRVPVFVSKAAA